MCAQFAVIVSAFAHVLHSLYKPFPDRASYLLQHLSLGVTTLVFTMGLLCVAAAQPPSHREC